MSWLPSRMLQVSGKEEVRKEIRVWIQNMLWRWVTHILLDFSLSKASWLSSICCQSVQVLCLHDEKQKYILIQQAMQCSKNCGESVVCAICPSKRFSEDGNEAGPTVWSGLHDWAGSERFIYMPPSLPTSSHKKCPPPAPLFPSSAGLIFTCLLNAFICFVLQA